MYVIHQVTRGKQLATVAQRRLRHVWQLVPVGEQDVTRDAMNALVNEMVDHCKPHFGFTMYVIDDKDIDMSLMGMTCVKFLQLINAARASIGRPYVSLEVSCTNMTQTIVGRLRAQL